MSKIYSVESLRHLVDERYKVLVVLKDQSTYVGTLNTGWGRGHYHLESLTTNDGGMGFPRSMIKQIVILPTGIVYPKEMHHLGKLKKLNILELNTLVNKAGYEFI